MRRILTTIGVLLVAAACHDRIRSNEVMLPGYPRVAVGSPVQSEGLMVGHVERVRRTDDGTRVTIAFLRDSQPPLIAESIGVKTTGLGQQVILEIRAGPQRPVFGPGGYIPGTGSPR